MTNPPTMKAPGVYIVEENAFPDAVVGVETALPAFIGYTQKAEVGGESLLGKPWLIDSLAAFQDCFGAGPGEDCLGFRLEPADAAPAGMAHDQPLAERDAAPFLLDQAPYRLTQTRGFYLLHACMRQFFLNGGGRCCVVSVGHYRDDDGIRIDKAALARGLTALEQQPDATLVVVPEAVLLPSAEDCFALQQAVLEHCGTTMKNRFAILDVREGYRQAAHCIEPFRAGIGNSDLGFGAAYYPWLHTAIVDDGELSHRCLDAASRDVLIACIKGELAAEDTSPALLAEVDKIKTLEVAPGMDAQAAAAMRQAIDGLARSLRTASPCYGQLIAELRRRVNLLPPAAALAGIYARVDADLGVWQAPANVAVAGTVAPAVKLTDAQQEDLNFAVTGKSINAIRAFQGSGTLVWGARTLDGINLDWRYINTRRTMIMLEESTRRALASYAPAPNDRNTWASIRAMLESFLTAIWKQGGLAGATPGEAFSVRVGLGETMSSQDILDGVLRVTVQVCTTRPADFIELSFAQAAPRP
ncbi:MAG: phage tail sheath family protein [Rhodocyclaceae bacterium]|nr:phage tail sheath family protein [Rhodocyclaceae bacterium]